MRVLVATWAFGPCGAEVEQALYRQREVDGRWLQYDRLVVADEDDAAPEVNGVMWAAAPPELPTLLPAFFLLQKPLRNALSGFYMRSTARNAAVDFAEEHGYDLLVTHDLDVSLFGPLSAPVTGFHALRVTRGVAGEAPVFGGTVPLETSGCHILNRHVFSRFRYCEEYHGRGPEAADFQWVTLWYAGVRDAECGFTGWHWPHERRNDNWRDAEGECSDNALWFRRTATEHFRTNLPHPDFPPHLAPAFQAVKNDVRLERFRELQKGLRGYECLPRGLQLSGWVEGPDGAMRRFGVWSKIGNDPITRHVGHLLRPEHRWVISRDPVFAFVPDWRQEDVPGIGMVHLSPEVGDESLDVLPENGILVERDGGLGDLVMLLPILVQLHRQGYYVCLACDPRYLSLFQSHPELDRVIDIEDQPWPSAPYTVDLRWKVDFGTHPWSRTHHRQDLWMEIIERELGFKADLPHRGERPDAWSGKPGARLPNLCLPQGVRDWAASWLHANGLPAHGFAVVNVASYVSPNRSYPHMAAVAGHLADYMPVVALHVHPWPECPANVRNLCAQFSVVEAAALIERAAILIGPDTGPIHVAGGLGVPVVALFGPIDPATRMTIYPNCRVLRARPDCEPCLEAPHCGPAAPRPCLSEIAPLTVVETALELLRETEEARRGRAVVAQEPPAFGAYVPLETTAHKHLTMQYCQGVGVDLGAGPDPIHARAIRVDVRPQYAHIHASAERLPWFTDGALDFVYASHLLEDFADWDPLLTEWGRVLKTGGHLALLLPDRARYREAVSLGWPDNLDHQHEAYPGEVTAHLARLGGWEVLVDRLAQDGRNADGFPFYNIVVVARKT